MATQADDVGVQRRHGGLIHPSPQDPGKISIASGVPEIPGQPRARGSIAAPPGPHRSTRRGAQIAHEMEALQKAHPDTAGSVTPSSV